ncbi:calcineurin-like phosphoesterase C-terminal domain-containing protein [Carboxylicivirga linearis]|uniref:Calcineurin-like phosphoesterase family protein n=1 Tax=Carboxylicivirga linearis TaxID=1628157 RepID=A0ABS5JXB5_9BACT|nr:calcineurin-like phosphoesterase family protein [Carboxylicivirga linearis]MBS2099463.1 calcineurin-like phosphoesterase family protein [Carboxylicivirga linearis]
MKYLILTLSFLFAVFSSKAIIGDEAIRLNGSNDEYQKAKGYVFHDENKNGVIDKNEKGIEGVLISNGVDIVKTNKKGKYEISVSNDAVIFIIKPDGWMTPLNQQNLPQFYYLYKPSGSPSDYKYAGIKPTGDLPYQINFPLYKVDSSDEFKLLVFGDTQPYSIEQIDFLAEDIITELVDNDEALFGITMGDIVGDDLSLFTPLNQAVAQIGIPWYNVTGNHDVNYMSPDDMQSNDTYKSIYGPSTYAFIYGKVHFIVLDDILHHEEAGSTKYEGGLRNDQLQFVENYLNTVPKDEIVVLNMHIPLAIDDSSFRKDDQKKLFDLLKDFPNTLSLSAHTHMQENRFFHKENTDWQQAVPHHHFNVGTSCGSWWCGLRNETDIPHTMMRDGTPNGYAFISFNGADYKIDWKVAGSSKDHQMNIHVPRGILAGSSDTTLLTVNFFNGCENSKLQYRIKGQTDWKEMTKVVKFDPYYEKIAQRWKNFKKIKLDEVWLADSTLTVQDFPGMPLMGPAKSTHIWEANIGSDFPVGRYMIEVKAEDRYGRTFTAFHTMRVAE